MYWMQSGGDHAPEEITQGAVEAVNEKNNIHVLLVGQEDVISEELEKYTYPKERMEIVRASEVIEQQSRQSWRSARKRIPPLW